MESWKETGLSHHHIISHKREGGDLFHFSSHGKWVEILAERWVDTTITINRGE